MSSAASRLARLMIVAADRPSEWIDKGEVIERYFNPGDLFEEVHLVLLNDDRPDPDALRTMVGSARLEVHNLPLPGRMFTRTLGYRPRLLRRWAGNVVELARATRPELLRCHGAGLNAYAACEVKRSLGVPYVVSLHINPAEDVVARAAPRERITHRAFRAAERRALREASLVLPVYRSIVPFLESVGVERYEVAYNMLNAENLVRKQDYSLGTPASIVSVGRQFAEKRPTMLIEAVSKLPGVTLTLIGDGPDHGLLRERVAALGISDRVTFHRSMSNAALCRALPNFDLFATHSEYWELSKATLEALASGLPLVLNRRRGAPVPELTPEICVLVDNSAEGYRVAIAELLADGSRREVLGRAAAARADAEWMPARTEARFVELYRQVVADRTPASA